MPVTRERADSEASRRAATMELKKLLFESPLGRHVDPWFVDVPEGHDYVPVWADPKKVQRKKIQYHAETVAPKYAIDVYKIPKDQVVAAGTHVERMGHILMHYPSRAYAARLAFPVVNHESMLDAAVREFNTHEDAVAMERVDGELVPVGRGSRQDPRVAGRRPRVRTTDDVLAAQGSRRRDIDPDDDREEEL